ncbi:MAG: VCBS repeat-containing protein [Proteobacteria bacterium]|nr:VCBS repeat-containing protein [Pseudomonadota bacterium]
MRIVMRFAAAALSGAVIFLPPLAAQAQDNGWRVDIVSLDGAKVADVFLADVGGGPAIVAETRNGAFFAVTFGEDGASVSRLADFTRPRPARRDGMLPDGEVSTGTKGIAEAWLTGPTRRYPHGIMGDTIEASGIRVVTAEGKILETTLGPNSVFEDRLARLADVDGDGRDEVIVVRSYLDAGAALAVYEVRDGALRRMAEAPAIGRPSRWLNPVGVADFDGDGVPELAAVITPHIGGILKIYSVEGDVLVEEAATGRGFSNHFIGSRELGLSAMADANGDGVTDIFVPSADRGALRIVTFAGGEFSEIANLPLPARVNTALVRAPGAAGPTFVFGLSDGRLAVVRRN